MNLNMVTFKIAGDICRNGWNCIVGTGSTYNGLGAIPGECQLERVTLDL